ncbi:MAG: HD-GYP domain-containing protein [Actinomycetota bacterium]
MPAAASLNRRLALRLGLGGIVIAAALGGAVVWVELERADDALVDHAVAEARQMQTLLPTPLDQNTASAADAALDAFVAQRKERSDHFALAEIYDIEQHTVAEASTEESKALEAAIDRSAHHFPTHGESWYLKHIVHGHVYMQVVIPLEDHAHRPIGWFEGVYRIAGATLSEATQAGLRIAGLVMVAVLATTGLLYPIIAGLNRSMLARSVALLDANLGALETLGSAIAKRDSDTGSHNYRVTLYAVRLAEAVGLDRERIRALVKGAFLHDIGKLAIPDAILLKPGKLDADEFAVMKTHVAHGMDVVSAYDWLSDAADVVAHHHEKFDGSGYLSGLSGTDIPVTARIFAIADVFDALTSRRPYKEPMPLGKALKILDEGRGTHFDPELVDTFVDIAAALFDTIGSCDEACLAVTLRAVTHDYFADTVVG